VSNPQQNNGTGGGKGQIDPREAARQTYLEMIRNVAKVFANAAPLSVPKDEVQRAIDRVMLAFRQMGMNKPELYECTPESVARCVSLSALTGLMPGGHAPDVDLIPRWNSKIKAKELNWQISWRGYKTLAARAGAIAQPVNVYQSDTFEWEEGLERKLVHKPRGERMVDDPGTLGSLTHTYVRIEYRDGRKDFVVMDRAMILKRRERSEGWKRHGLAGFWGEWPDEMCMKTAIRYAGQRGVLPLDDVARYAFEEDGKEDGDQRIVDMRSTPNGYVPAAPEPKAIAPTTGLDGLDAVFGAGYDRQKDHAPVGADDGDDQHQATPVDQGKGAESKTPTKVDPKPSKSQGKPSKADARLALIDQVKELEEAAGEAAIKSARGTMGFNVTASAEAIVDSHDADAIDAYMKRLSWRQS
jgi:phage RecT family recombinase